MKTKHTPGKLYAEIRKRKGLAINQASSSGIYENFGELEIRELEEKYDILTLRYGTETERSMAAAIDSFSDWCANFTL